MYPLRGICSGVLSPLFLGGAQPLIAVFSSRSPSVLTRRGVYNLGDRAEVESWGVDQRSPLLGLEPAETAALRTPGELVEEQWLLQELQLALGWALRRPPVLVEHREAGTSLSNMGEGSGHPRPNPVEFSFLSSVNFCAINIFPFPFWIQNLVQVRRY